MTKRRAYSSNKLGARRFAWRGDIKFRNQYFGSRNVANEEVLGERGHDASSFAEGLVSVSPEFNVELPIRGYLGSTNGLAEGKEGLGCSGVGNG
jgi:hypothetical protein